MSSPFPLFSSLTLSSFMRRSYTQDPERRSRVLTARRAQTELKKTRQSLGFPPKGAHIPETEIARTQDVFRDFYVRHSLQTIFCPSWTEIGVAKCFVCINQLPLAIMSLMVSKLHKGISTIVTTLRHPAFKSMEQLSHIGERKRNAIKAWRNLREGYGYRRSF